MQIRKKMEKMVCWRIRIQTFSGSFMNFQKHVSFNTQKHSCVDISLPLVERESDWGERRDRRWSQKNRHQDRFHSWIWPLMNYHCLEIHYSSSCLLDCWLCWLPSLKLTADPWKWMVGRHFLVSFWEWNCLFFREKNSNCPPKLVRFRVFRWSIRASRNAQRILSQRLKNELEVKVEQVKIEEVKIESSDDERRDGGILILMLFFPGAGGAVVVKTAGSLFLLPFTAGNGWNMLKMGDETHVLTFFDLKLSAHFKMK